MTANDEQKVKRKYTAHTCDYTCEKIRCIKRQRDELVKENAALKLQIKLDEATLNALHSRIDGTDQKPFAFIQRVRDRLGL